MFEQQQEATQKGNLDSSKDLVFFPPSVVRATDICEPRVGVLDVPEQTFWLIFDDFKHALRSRFLQEPF